MFLLDIFGSRSLFENASPIELAEIFFNAIKEKYPEAIERYGQEAISNAAMDRAEDANIHNMGEVAIAVDEILADLANDEQSQELNSKV